MRVQQFAATLAAAWAGILIGVGYVFTPVLFKVMTNERQYAGQIAGEAFAAVAYISLVLGIIVLIIVRRENTRAGFSTPNAPLYLILIALGLAIIGHFVITPELIIAKTTGNARWSFATLHLVSHVVYMAQVVTLVALNWVLYKPIVMPAYVAQALSEAKAAKEKQKEAEQVNTENTENTENKKDE